MPNNPNAAANLTPWKPGQSGNLKGKPKGIEHSKTRLTRLLKLTQKMPNPVTGEIEEFTVMEQIDMKLIQKARSGDLKAISLLGDRLEGKPMQGIDVTSAGEQLNRGTIDPAVAADYANYLKGGKKSDDYER